MKKTALAILMLSSIVNADANLGNLPTGVTKNSYDANGNIVKDDAYYKRGGEKTYDVKVGNDGNKIIIDNLTKLQWQDHSDNKDKTFKWDDAVKYCNDLVYAGYSDYRLPSINELQSIVDYGKSAPSINSVFRSTSSSYYWSSTVKDTNTYKDSEGKSYTGYPWVVYFNYGNSGNYSNKTDSYYVRCVRGGQ
jgi:hypothetical protein